MPREDFEVDEQENNHWGKDVLPKESGTISYGTSINLSTPNYEGKSLIPPKDSGDNGAIALTAQAGPFKGWLRLTWRGVVNTYYYDTDTGWGYTENEPSLYWKPSGGIPSTDLNSDLSSAIAGGKEVFDVTYGETTIDEICNAYMDGKLVRLIFQGRIVDLKMITNSVQARQARFYDVVPDSPATGYVYTCVLDRDTEETVWRAVEYDYATADAFDTWVHELKTLGDRVSALEDANA